jgi:hypothetical protein
MSIATEYVDSSFLNELEQLEAAVTQPKKIYTPPPRGNFVYNLGNQVVSYPMRMEFYFFLIT